MWVEASLMRKSWLCDDLGGRHLSGRNSLCKGPETGASLWWETVNQRMGVEREVRQGQKTGFGPV